jgi:hypothetical protein
MTKYPYSEEARITIELNFVVTDAEALRKKAKKLIKKHGLGHEFDPDNLADCLVEALLHSNPDIPPYADYGVELQRTTLRNHVGVVNMPASVVQSK